MDLARSHLRASCRGRFHKSRGGPAPDAPPATLEADEDTSEPDRAVKPRSGLVYAPATATKVDLPARHERRPVLLADRITVHFAELTAVDDARDDEPLRHRQARPALRHGAEGRATEPTRNQLDRVDLTEERVR